MKQRPAPPALRRRALTRPYGREHTSAACAKRVNFLHAQTPCRSAHAGVAGFPDADLSPGRWDGVLGEYLLEWDDVRTAGDPEGVVLDFARRVFRHACALCGWDETLAASAEGRPPPVS